MPAFRDEVNRFIAALKTANASVRVSETYRSRERTYLMHYSYRIARENLDPATVSAAEGVNICWLHRDAKGNPDRAASRRAAQQMVKAYNIAFKPTLDSDHIERPQRHVRPSFGIHVAVPTSAASDRRSRVV